MSDLLAITGLIPDLSNIVLSFASRADRIFWGLHVPGFLYTDKKKLIRRACRERKENLLFDIIDADSDYVYEKYTVPILMRVPVRDLEWTYDFLSRYSPDNSEISLNKAETDPKRFSVYLDLLASDHIPDNTGNIFLQEHMKVIYNNIKSRPGYLSNKKHWTFLIGKCLDKIDGPVKIDEYKDPALYDNEFTDTLLIAAIRHSKLDLVRRILDRTVSRPKYGSLSYAVSERSVDALKLMIPLTEEPNIYIRLIRFAMCSRSKECLDFLLDYSVLLDELTETQVKQYLIKYEIR
jgi:hypothetical protein